MIKGKKMVAGGVVERGWVLQLVVVIHGQCCRRRFHYTSCPSHYCFCPNCPRPHVQAWGIKIFILLLFFHFLKVIKNFIFFFLFYLIILAGICAEAQWCGTEAELGDGSTVINISQNKDDEPSYLFLNTNQVICLTFCIFL